MRSSFDYCSKILLCFSLVLVSTLSKAQWVQKSGGLEGCPVDALHSDGSSIFAGTSVGVYSSTLTGTVWSFMNGPSSPYNQFMNINCIAGTSDNLFAGTPYGAMRSQNGGQSWTALRTGMERSVQCMLFFSDKIYAGSHTGGISRSENNGELWTPINNGLPNSVGVTAIKNIGDIIYIATAEGVYQSTDEGASWQEIHPENNLLLVTDIATKENMMVTASSFSQLHISTHDGTTWSPWEKINTGLPVDLDINALVVHNESVYAGTNQGLYQYDSDGNNWSLLQNDQLSALPIYSLHSAGSNLLAGTSDGVYLSTDNGGSWSILKTGLTCTQVRRFVPFNDRLFAQTNNGLFVLNNGSTWSQVNKVPISSLTVMNNKLFSSGRSGAQVSEDEGLTWKAATSGLPANPIIGRMMAHGSKLFAGVNDYSNLVYVSSNEGESWAPADTGLPASPLVSDFASKGGTIYTAIAAQVYKSVDNGTTWVSCSAGLPADDHSSSIYFLRVHGNDLYVGFCCGKGLFKSSDDALSWTPFNNGIPSTTDLFAMEANETNLFVGGRVFVGQFGVYTMSNNDDSWTPSNAGLPMFQNNALTIYDNILFGSFSGDKSVWSQPVQNITTGIESYTQRSSCHDIGINVFPSPARGYIHIEADENVYGLKEIIISDVSGKPIHHTFENSTGDIKLDISDFVSGMYIVKVGDGQKSCYTKFVKQ